VPGAAPTSDTRRRVERFDRAGSTNDIVRAWLADGEPEMCVAVAAEQTAGRGRLGRPWIAPAGAALLVSLGFRPTWLPVERTWRLGASVALAMADAAEDVAGLPVGSVRCKWPNDLVIEVAGPNALLTGVSDAGDAAGRLAAPIELRKLAGILGESDGLGTPDPRVVVGIGINADWAAADFPPDLAGTMTSLREASGGRPIDRDALLEAFLERVDGRLEALRAGYFDLAAWASRQSVTGRLVTLEGTGNTPTAVSDGVRAGDPVRAGSPVRALGIDAGTGGLVIEDPWAPSGERVVHTGEIVHVRLAPGQV
jgi:BirA family transcriptional regulator, biotin operon repressor / biotin---[acetyl-CoA-carboxylase] ligase